MTNQSPIEALVMRRVHRIHALRFVVNGFTASCLLLLLALWGIGREVWVAMVLHNMPHSSLVAIGNFYLAAFAHTHLVVQALCILCLASTIYIARATAQIISQTFVPVQA